MNICIVGKACAGKTTFAEATELNIIKFAGPLYLVNEVLDVGKNRAFMQEFSDLVKEHFGRDYFIKRFAEYVYDAPNRRYIRYVCDDVRYRRELNYLKSRGWKTIYIDATEDVRRQRAAALGLEFLPDHPSESGVEALKPLCDVYIDNSYLAIEDFREMAANEQRI